MSHSSTVFKAGAEVLRVTADGRFIWADNADELIEHGDFTETPALPHILRALRRAVPDHREMKPADPERTARLIQKLRENPPVFPY